MNETLVRHNLGDNPEHAAVALQTAIESVVVLNNNDGALPLDLARLMKMKMNGGKPLVVIGPNATVCRQLCVCPWNNTKTFSSSSSQGGVVP